MRGVLDRLEEALVALTLVGMTLLTFSQVVLRYGFNAGWVWSLEATTTMFGWMLMVGISYGMREHAHLNVDAFVNLLPKRWRRRLGLLAIAGCLAYVALMIWGGWELEQRLYRLGTNARDLPLRRWVMMAILPLGFALLGYRLLQIAGEIVRGQRDKLGSSHADPAHEGLLDAPASAEQRQSP